MNTKGRTRLPEDEITNNGPQDVDFLMVGRSSEDRVKAIFMDNDHKFVFITVDSITLTFTPKEFKKVGVDVADALVKMLIRIPEDGTGS